MNNKKKKRTTTEEMLRFSQIEVDSSYQRDLDEKRAEEIAAGWDPDLVEMPTVSKRADGKYYMVEGQHRQNGAIRAGKGEELFLMRVHHGLTREEEAQLFVALNGKRVSVSAYHNYRARLKSKETIACEIDAILCRFGYRVTHSCCVLGIAAVKAVECAHKNRTLEPTIQILHAWGAGQPGFLDGSLIRGVSAFLKKYPEAEPEHLSKQLKELPPELLVTRLLRETKALHCSVADAACTVFQEIYNKKTRARAVPCALKKLTRRKAA